MRDTGRAEQAGIDASVPVSVNRTKPETARVSMGVDCLLLRQSIHLFNAKRFPQSRSFSHSPQLQCVSDCIDGVSYWIPSQL